MTRFTEMLKKYQVSTRLCTFLVKLSRSINSYEITHHVNLQKERISGVKLDIYGAPWFYAILCYPLFRVSIIITNKFVSVNQRCLTVQEQHDINRLFVKPGKIGGFIRSRGKFHS